MRPIKKAVFPVAGMGTRFLPATKASPKEMLPIVDKPLIQYAVEEAVEAGCTEMVFITGRNKRSIEDHFDKAYELETELEMRQKDKLLEHVKDILPSNITCLYIRQAEALGLGHAVLCARAAVGDEPFAVILADDLIDAPKGALKQMVDIYNQSGNSVLGVETVDPSQTGSYGIVEVEKLNSFQRITNIVEKPKPEEAPSNLAVVGRYILTPRIFSLLENLPRGAGNEIQLTDGIARLLDHEFVLAHAFDGKRYDCGSKLGYLEATVAYGLKHPETGAQFRELLKLLIIASFIGGCAGSVGGGLRVARILVLYLQGARELKRFVHPNLVYPIKWGQNVLDERVIGSIWAFFSAYLLVFTICLLSVIACGVAPFDAFNAVLASINNLGPGLGSVSSNMTAMPDSAKWILTIAMVCGRLEIFTLLALFTPAFWKE